ncbi:MmyB family transcriptional regulator [Streptomyces sp. NBC_01476]|uniref:MmyB family transcriptional regulator n=1 Tax=Streptomyces sp. NBC_01476 TaxID=2903881 RepID=UPI002E349504|nr:helix-turn-helix domain-containing protein [Streptomyces sp. NBC_01476]
MAGTMDLRTEIREFLRSRRSRITPDRAGLPAYGGNRRVKGLRRGEVALLAGVSVEYYVRRERGALAGTSEGVLNALASALRLDDAERDHLFHLARQSGAPSGRRRRKPVATADPRRPANTARFVYLNHDAARTFFVDYDQVTRNAAATLRMEAGRDPHDEELVALIGELSTCSELFRQRPAADNLARRLREALAVPVSAGSRPRPGRLPHLCTGARPHTEQARAGRPIPQEHLSCDNAN